MKPMDIMDALNDMDDEILQRAELTPAAKRHSFFRTLRMATAACLACVMIVTALFVTSAIASETGLRWTVEYQEDGIVWSFTDGKRLNKTQYNEYRPTWYPDGYLLVSAELAQTYNWSYGHWPNAKRVGVNMGQIYFHANNIVDTQKLHLLSFPAGSYNIQSVEIDHLPGELYTHLDDPNSGELIWIDKNGYMVYRLIFQNCDTETVLKIAESVEEIR